MGDENHTITFGNFRLTGNPMRLFAGGDEVKLRHQGKRLLRLLAERPGRFVSHEEIRLSLWGDRCVDSVSGTHLIIREIRKALGDDAANPKYIETVPRQGYRFVAPAAVSETTDRQYSPNATPRRRTVIAGLVVALALLLSFDSWWRAFEKSVPGADSDAEIAYQKGDYLLERGGAVNLDKAVQYFNEALAIDESYTLARAGLAVALAQRGEFDTAEAHAKQVLAAAPHLADPHNVLAWVAIHRDWNWKAAQSHLAQSLIRDSANPETYSIQAWLLIVVGQRDEAKIAAQRAFELDPVSSLVRTDNGWFHLFAGDYSSGLRICSEARHLDPGNTAAVRCEFKSALLLGDYSAASDAAARILETWNIAPEIVQTLKQEPGWESMQKFFALRRHRLNQQRQSREVSTAVLAAAYAEIGDLEHAASLVAESIKSPVPNLPYLLRDPALGPIHQDPRYLAARRFAGIAN